MPIPASRSWDHRPVVTWAAAARILTCRTGRQDLPSLCFPGYRKMRGGSDRNPAFQHAAIIHSTPASSAKAADAERLVDSSGFISLIFMKSAAFISMISRASRAEKHFHPPVFVSTCFCDKGSPSISSARTGCSTSSARCRHLLSAYNFHRRIRSPALVRINADPHLEPPAYFRNTFKIRFRIEPRLLQL